MTKFVAENKCSLKGIIDYEIAKKKREKREFYIPVFYSSPKRPLASGDSTYVINYLKKVKKARNLLLNIWCIKETILYLLVEKRQPIKSFFL